MSQPTVIVATASYDHTIRFWEAKSGRCYRTIQYPDSCVGNWMYSGSEDGTVKIWDLRAPGCQREYESGAAVNTVVLHPNQTELISGDQNGNIRVWDLTASSCSCELVPEVDTAVRSLTVMWDGSLVVAANNHGTCYVWRLLRDNDKL